MLDINKLVETIILDRNPKTKIRSNSSNDGMPRFANISLALLFYGQQYMIFCTFSDEHIESPRTELLVNIDPLNMTSHLTRYPHQFDTRVLAVIRNTRWKLITGNPGM